MNRLLFALLCLALPAAAQPQAPDVKRPPAAAQIAALSTGTWTESAATLADALMTAYGPGVATLPAYEQWYGLYRWCDLLAQGDASAPAPSADLLALLGDAETTSLLFRTLRREDNARAVADQLAALRAAQPAKFAEYRKLAVALAVVFDQPAPENWPHHQVPRDKVPLETERNTTPDRFAFWIKANESGKLVYDLRRLEVDELKFVVATFLAWSELEWAWKNVRFSKPAAVTLYSSVRYDKPRLDRDQFTWPHDAPYTLENIRKLGGICVDQAFYAAEVAKSRGMPALTFSGDGVRGGHAWAGLMLADNKWDMDCGRYAYDNYATGEAVDPQVWQPITDHELNLLMQRFRDRPDYAASTFHLAMASVFAAHQDPVRQGQAIDNAHRVCLGNPDAWAAKAAWFEERKTPPAQQRQFLETALRQFANVPELRSQYARRLVEVLQALGDSAGASKLLAQEMSRNKTDRTDLSASAAAEQIRKLLAAGNDTETFQAYRKALTQLGRTAPNEMLRDVVTPTLTALRDAGKTDLARKCFDVARDRLFVSGANEALARELDALGESVGVKPRKR